MFFTYPDYQEFGLIKLKTLFSSLKLVGVSVHEPQRNTNKGENINTKLF